MLSLLCAAAAVAATLGKHARLFSGNIQTLQGTWEDGVSGGLECVAGINETSTTCEALVWFKGRSIVVDGTLHTGVLSFDVEGGYKKMIVTPTASPLYTAVFPDARPRALRIKAGPSPHPTLSLHYLRTYTGAYHPPSHWGLTGVWTTTPDHVASSSSSATAYLQWYGGTLTLHHASLANEVLIEVDGVHTGTMSSGYATTLTTTANSVHVVVLRLMSGTVTLKGAETFPLAQTAFSLNLGSPDPVTHEGIMYHPDTHPTPSPKQEVFGYLTLPSPSLPALFHTFRTAPVGAPLELTLPARPGLYTLHVLMSVSLQHLHEESPGYHDVSAASELRKQHLASVSKADRCLCPAAVSFMSDTGTVWDGYADPLKGLQCAGTCGYVNWKVKYYCASAVTVTFNGYPVVEGHDLAVATGGLLGEVDISAAVEIKQPAHHGVLKVTPLRPAHTVTVNGVSLVPLVSTSYFSL